MNLLKNRLKEFKLAGIFNTLEERINYANEKSLSYPEFLEILLEDEINNRRDNSYKKRYQKARFPFKRTIEEFDFNFQPSIDKKIINDCCTCQFIKENKNIVLIGAPGCGKTHLSIGIGMKALIKGFKVLFTSVSDLLNNLKYARADNTYFKKLNEYLTPDLLIIDELGFKKISEPLVDDFFEIISKRYEQGSIIINSNKSFEQWADILGDPVLATAILDRIVHHSILIKITGDSYRMKNLKKKR